MMAGEKYVEKPHPPGESFAVNLSDETGEERDGAQMATFVDCLRAIQIPSKIYASTIATIAWRDS